MTNIKISFEEIANKKTMDWPNLEYAPVFQFIIEYDDIQSTINYTQKDIKCYQWSDLIEALAYDWDKNEHGSYCIDFMNSNYIKTKNGTTRFHINGCDKHSPGENENYDVDIIIPNEYCVDVFKEAHSSLINYKKRGGHLSADF